MIFFIDTVSNEPLDAIKFSGFFILISMLTSHEFRVYDGVYHMERSRLSECTVHGAKGLLQYTVSRSSSCFESQCHEY